MSVKILTLDEAAVELRKFMPSQQTTNWDFALDQMKELMSALGNPQEHLKVIHVAGTSGKTSTSYYIADMLRQTGQMVGLTVSPHVDTINERVQIDGRPLPEKEFCKLLGEFLDLPAIKQYQPSYFGVMIAFAYWVFARFKVDYAVVEVGLGGRLDATNVIERPEKVSVITDIGLDHTGMLGNTLASIASEKSGIIQPKNHVIVAQQDPEILDVIKGRAKTQQAELEILEPGQAPNALPLFQRRNWFVARAVVEYVAKRDKLTFTSEDAKNSARILIPARMEVIEHKGKTIILDGAHNVQKITALCQSIRQKYPNQKLAAVVSFVHNKDESMIKKMAALKTVVDHLIITTFRVEQDEAKWSVEPTVIKSAAQDAGFASVAVTDNPKDAFEALLERPEEVVLVTGSFYLLNHIRPLVRSKHD